MMKMSKSLLFCLVVCCGLYNLSDGATIPSMLTNVVKDVGSSGMTLLSTVDDILGCSSKDSDNIPSPTEIATNPIQSLTQSLCFILKRVSDLTKSTNDLMENPVSTLLQTLFPPIMAVLKSVHDSNIVPEPLNLWLQTILNLYDINRLLMNAI
ncbi:PREDICTED: uncharacterized protein LOC107070819 [Polistes dominula]|uniref:Uncharacterized protein LOC107070819 n=1 Tax=Polistes dominula TaxID=743375 RepID=A0ABM1IX90_POLDO|nr:PREDICTED: uncharacterized protein LOC107070819 [Polistes dominula]